MTEKRDRKRLPPQSILWILAVAFYSPLTRFAENAERLTEGYRLLLYGAVVVALLLTILWIIERLGGSSFRSAYALGAGWLAQSISGSLEIWMGVFLSGIIATIAYRLADWRTFRSVVAVFLVVAIGGLVVEASYRALSRDHHALTKFSLPSDQTEGIDTPPDAWLIVMDGFPSRFTLEEQFGFDVDLEAVFERHRISVNTTALSPYAWTHLSLASLLEASPIASEGTTVGSAEWSRLRDIIGGDNRLVNTFKERGFRVTIVENGWHLSGCGVRIDHCVSRPILDEQISLVLSSSVLGRLLGFSYDKFLTRGAEHAMAQTKNILSNLDDRIGEEPQLTIIHLLIPHPPFVFDAACGRLTHDADLGGVLFAPAAASEEERQQRIESYVDQVRCSLQWLDDVLRRIPPNDIVGVAGDHGPDSRGQLQVLASAWSKPMLKERLLTVAAFRGPGCVAQLDWIIGVTQAMIECISGVVMPSTPPRAFLAEEIASRHMDIIEVDNVVIEELLSR